MNELISAYEASIRIAIFATLFVAIACWELLRARRPLSVRRRQRWPGNIGVLVVDAVIVRLVFPAAATGIAIVAQAQEWGLFNAVQLPLWLAVPLCMLLLDLAIYTQHVLFHKVPALWRLHRMHHADLDFDVTTGVRFHPAEILLSMLIKAVIIVLLGAPALAVLLFEVLLNATSLFNHANARLPSGADSFLRTIVVTPDMHRVHHSIVRVERDSNFGFNFPWWDRLFSTYRAQPAAGHAGMTIGIPEFRDTAALRLDRMLIQPLLRK